MNSTTLFLIRHGETDWNLEEKLQGHTDIPLNTKGKEQAQKAAAFLKKETLNLKLFIPLIYKEPIKLPKKSTSFFL